MYRCARVVSDLVRNISTNAYLLVFIMSKQLGLLSLGSGFSSWTRSSSLIKSSFHPETRSLHGALLRSQASSFNAAHFVVT